MISTLSRLISPRNNNLTTFVSGNINQSIDRSIESNRMFDWKRKGKKFLVHTHDHYDDGHNFPFWIFSHSHSLSIYKCYVNQKNEKTKVVINLHPAYFLSLPHSIKLLMMMIFQYFFLSHHHHHLVMYLGKQTNGEKGNNVFPHLLLVVVVMFIWWFIQQK